MPRGRPKKIIEQTTTENPIVVAPVIHTVKISDKKDELIKLLKKEMHQCYDAEPRGSLTSHFNTMVEDIINLFAN